MNFFQREGRGIILAAALGVLSFFLAEFTPSAVNSVMIALILGITLGNATNLPESVESGISYTSSKLLELSILFLAFAINYSHITELGATSFIAVAAVLFIILILSVVLAQKFNCPGSTGWLVGFGTAICGSSAIAALAPSVSKDKEDVAISMAVVNLYGTLGMIGEEAGEAAITIKLARVALLTPGLIFINFLINRKTAATWKDHFKLPWYLIGFIVITVLGTVVEFPESWLELMESCGKVVLTVAMAAIGMKVRFKKLILSGRKGLSFGLIMFLIQLGLLATFIKLT